MSNNNLATLVITSSVLTTQDITNYLKINPNRSHDKGTPLNPRIPDKNIRDKSSWMLRSKLNQETSLEEKINELLDIVQSNLDLFREIEKYIDIEIYCSLFLKEKSSTFYLSSKTLAKISTIPIDIIVAIYPYDESEQN